MIVTSRARGGPSVRTAGPRPAKSRWNELIQALVLVRLGQELGTDSRTAQAIASVIDMVIAIVGKVMQ